MGSSRLTPAIRPSQPKSAFNLSDQPGTSLAALMQSELVDTEALFETFSRWLADDPAAAVRWVMAQDDSALHPQLRAALTRFYLTLAPEVAAEELLAHPESGAWSFTVQLWAESDSVAVLTWLRSLPTDQPDRLPSLALLSNQWAGSDLPGLVAELPNLGASDARGHLLGAAAATWGRRDGPAALAWASGLTDADERRRATELIVTGWSEADPAAALVWMLQQPERSSAEDAFASIVYQWRKQSREPAQLLVALEGAPQLQAQAATVLTDFFP